MVVGKQKGIGIEFHYVARPTDNFSFLEETGDKILQAAASPHNDDLVTAADGLVR
jgi:hypothetical protein